MENKKYTFNNDDKLYILSICVISIFIFIYYVTQNVSVNYYDENGYIGISKSILQNGLFNINEPIRTYMYPLLISFFNLICNNNLIRTKLMFSIFQFIVYLISIVLIALTTISISNKKIIWRTVLAFGLLNPYLIQATTLFLTDILATCLVVISTIFVLRLDLNKTFNIALIAGFSYSSIMIRPSSLIFLYILFTLILIRFATKKDFKLIKIAPAFLLMSIIFVPQLYNNVTQFHHWTPLIHNSLYTQQSIWAVQNLKYGTMVIPGMNPQLYYINPFSVANGINMYKLINLNFVLFVFTYFSCP